MYELIIKNYINSLTKNDLILFGLKNNIILNNSELDYIYKTIKNDYKTLLSNNYEYVFKNAKNYINPDNYKKIYNLFLDYRSKYQNYFN